MRSKGLYVRNSEFEERKIEINPYFLLRFTGYHCVLEMPLFKWREVMFRIDDVTLIFQDGSFVRRNASSLDNFYTIKAALKATGQISGSVAATSFF